MIASVRLGKRFMLFPRPQVADSVGMVHVFGTCVACGETLDSAGVVGTFMLECRHLYHPLCFSALLHSREQCAKAGCNMVISEVAKSWIGGLNAVKKDETDELINKVLRDLKNSRVDNKGIEQGGDIMGAGEGDNAYNGEFDGSNVVKDYKERKTEEELEDAEDMKGEGAEDAEDMKGEEAEDAEDMKGEGAEDAKDMKGEGAEDAKQGEETKAKKVEEAERERVKDAKQEKGTDAMKEKEGNREKEEAAKQGQRGSKKGKGAQKERAKHAMRTGGAYAAKNVDGANSHKEQVGEDEEKDSTQGDKDLKHTSAKDNTRDMDLDPEVDTIDVDADDDAKDEAVEDPNVESTEGDGDATIKDEVEKPSGDSTDSATLLELFAMQRKKPSRGRGRGRLSRTCKL